MSVIRPIHLKFNYVGFSNLSVWTVTYMYIVHVYTVRLSGNLTNARVFTGDSHLQIGHVLNIYGAARYSIYTLTCSYYFRLWSLVKASVYAQRLSHIFLALLTKACPMRTKRVRNACDTRVIVKLALSRTVYVSIHPLCYSIHNINYSGQNVSFDRIKCRFGYSNLHFSLNSKSFY